MDFVPILLLSCALAVKEIMRAYRVPARWSWPRGIDAFVAGLTLVVVLILAFRALSLLQP